MADVIIILILLCITGFALRYLYRAKKSGGKCIGCPYSKQCGSRRSGSAGESCSGSDSATSD